MTPTLAPPEGAPTVMAPAPERPPRRMRRPSRPARLGRPRRPGRHMTVRAIVQFAVSGLAALVLLGGGSVLIFQARGEREALRDARQLTRAIGLGMVAPRLTDGVLHGDRADVDAFHAYVTNGVKRLDPAIVRIKLWRRDGTIVYSDQRRLIGSRYPLGGEEREAFRTRRVKAEVSDLGRRENRFERGGGKLLEVYLPVRTRSGEEVLFEIYLRYSAVADDAHDIWTDFAPALLAALALMWLAQLPLAWSLARRLQRGQRERETLLVSAMEASERERRRIAGDLHDGVVQDLAGLSLTLAAAAERTDDPEAAPVFAGAASSTRHSIRQMRSLLVDIYPANLHTAGLHAALADLVAPLAARGLATHVEAEDSLAAAPEVEQLVYRTAQEALRNVLRHAAATTVWVEASLDGDTLRLLVEDDGRGFRPAEMRAARSDGHFGLSLLGDRAGAMGGFLIIDSEPGLGTRVRLEVPAA